MRRDQPQLKKEFKELKAAIKLFQHIMKRRDVTIEFLAEEIGELNEEVLIASIEYQRLLAGKPALTWHYNISRQLANKIILDECIYDSF